MTESISPTMDQDPAKEISDGCGVCRQESLYYLEGFNGDLNSATEACRNKTLPPRKDPSSPPTSDEDESDVEDPPTPPHTPYHPATNWPGVSIVPPPQLTDELISSFLSVAPGAQPDVARSFLINCSWDVNAAVNLYYEGPPKEAVIGGGSSSSSLQIKETEKSLNEVPIMIPSGPRVQAKKDNDDDDDDSSSMKTWIDRICDENNVSRDEALYYLEVSNWDFDVAMEACPEKTLVPVKDTSSSDDDDSGVSNFLQEQLSPFEKDRISSFCGMVGATPGQAMSYLALCTWDFDVAVNCFLAGMSIQELSDSKSASLATGPSTLPESQYEEASRSQTQSHLKEGEIQSSSSSAETERLLKTAEEEKMTLAATLGTGSSQVKGKAVEEDSRKEIPKARKKLTFVGPRPPETTMTIAIILIDGETVKIPFRLDQTVRDIREAIDERTPGGDRDYYLQSDTALQCTDLNMTVKRIFPGELDELHHLFQISSDE